MFCLKNAGQKVWGGQDKTLQVAKIKNLLGLHIKLPGIKEVKKILGVARVPPPYNVGPLLVIAQDLIRVIFEDIDPVWLRTMWEVGGSTRVDMIEF